MPDAKITTTRQRQQLRRQFRQQRRALSVGQRRRASARFGPALARAIQHRPARHVAIYLPNDGELDVRPALRHPRFQQASPNAYGIHEPALRYRGRALWALDVIILPAVAFDEAGYRLGMGGGYYDRTLAQLARHPRRPRLVAAGYDFQKMARGEIPVAPWDQPVDSVVTAASE